MEIMLQTTILHMIATDLPHHTTTMIHTAIIILDKTTDTRDGGAQVIEVTTEETGSQMIKMITMKGAGKLGDEEVDPRHRGVEIVVLAMTKTIIAVVGGVRDGMILRRSAAV